MDTISFGLLLMLTMVVIGVYYIIPFICGFALYVFVESYIRGMSFFKCMILIWNELKVGIPIFSHSSKSRLANTSEKLVFSVIIFVLMCNVVYFIIVANAIRLGALLATGWEYGMLLSINVASSAQIMQAIILFIITKQCIKLYFLRDKNLNIKLIVKLFLAVVFLISVLYLYFVKAFVMWIGISHYAEEVMSRLYQYLIWLWPSFIALLSIWSAWDDIHKSANINSKL